MNLEETLQSILRSAFQEVLAMENKQNHNKFPLANTYSQSSTQNIENLLLFPHWVDAPSLICTFIESNFQQKPTALLFANQNNLGRKYPHSYSLTNKPDIAEIPKVVETVKTAWFISPGIETLRQLTQLKDNNDTLESLAIRLLIKGVRVELLITSPLTKFNKGTEEYLNLLKTAVDKGFFINYSARKPLNAATFASNSLLQEQDIEQIFQAGYRQITVAQNCILTPLAIDKARLTGMQIDKSLV